MIKDKQTESVEMYLAAISTLGGDNETAPIPISALAEKLDVQPISANQMVKRIEKKGLVKYIPYKGATLTKRGRELALRVLRNRRLWEVFFVKELGMPLAEADVLACDFEHITPDDLANRLSLFLGDPTICYHGYPIPQTQMNKEGARLFAGMPLNDLRIGESAQIMRIDAQKTTADFLFTEGIKPGERVRIVAIGSGGDVLVECEAGRMRVSDDMASVIIVGQPETAQQLTPEKPVPLSDLKIGERGRIVKLKFKGSARQRLMAMGMIKGESVLVRRVAPLGDPVDFVIKGYDLSLRKTEAKKILVTREKSK